MRKTFIVVLVLFLSILIGLIMASTETHSTITRIGAPVYETFDCLKVDFEKDVNNATITLGKIQGYIDGLVIDSNGTDELFQVYVKDEHDIVIFSKTNCTSASEPYRFAISASDTGTTSYIGVPVNGNPKVQIADANDDGMNDMVIYLYYRDWRK